MFSHPSLLASIIAHLSEDKLAAVHHHWLSVINNSLPHVISQPITANFLQSVVSSVCSIFDRICANFDNPFVMLVRVTTM